MLTINHDQWSRLQAASVDDFCRRAAQFVRVHYPEPTGGLDDASLRLFVARCRNKSIVYKIDSELTIVYWIILALLGGEEFYKIQKIDTALRSELGGEAVIEALIQRLAVLEVRARRL